MKFSLLTAIVFSFFLSTNSFAATATVAKVKGRLVLIKSSKKMKVGQLYYMVTKSGKKTGIIRIMKSKPGKSIAKLLKGKAMPKLKLVKRKKGKSSKSVAKNRKRKASKRKSPSTGSSVSDLSLFSLQRLKNVGLMGGFNANSAEVDFNDEQGNGLRKDTYSGTSISFKLFFDYLFSDKLTFRAGVGQQKFEAGGDESNTNCSNASGTTAVCQVDLSYISLDGWVQYYFLKKPKFNVWAGIGATGLFAPDGGETTALQVETTEATETQAASEGLGTSVLFSVGAGLDFNVTDRLFIPARANYSLYAPSDTVDFSAISGYLGLGYRL
jgi:hypothetical protein